MWTDTERSSAVLPLAALLAAVAACEQPPSEPPAPGTPRLVVLVAVDQLRGDAIDRFDRYWEGGFRWLLDHGARWVDARHDHAITHTAPGHASLATGCLPSRHGVIANNWIDRATGEEVYSAEDDEDSESPVRLQCDALGDWLKARYSEARVVSLAAKDRTAVALGGQRPDSVLFYDDETGGFETASYYADEPPEWVAEFNERRPLDRWFGTAWEPLPTNAEELAALGVESIDLGPLEPDFPITFGGLTPVPGSSYYGAVRYSPWIDEVTADLAQTAVGAEALGGDEVPDLLAVGFSGVDYVGHRYGPDSPQMLDALRRVDLALGRLLEFLDRRIGLDNVVVALSSDHGAVGVPELRQRRAQPGRRVGDDDVLCMQGVDARLRGRFGEGRWLDPGPFISEAATEAGLADEVEAAVEALISRCQGVREVWTRSELLDPATAEDPIGRLFVHSFHPERSPDFMVLREEFFLGSTEVAASHGTPWPYDITIPLIVAGGGVVPGPRGVAVRSVDLAPTLGWLVGAAPPAEIDGVVLDTGD